MSHIHKIVFAFFALLQSSLYAAQVQQKSQKQLNEMYATAKTLGYFHLWKEKSLPEIKEFLTKYGAEIVNFAHPESGNTLLICATDKTWSLEGFKEILALPHVNVNLGRASTEDWDADMEVYGQTALMMAANRLQIEKVKLLLEHNADTTLKSRYGLEGKSYYIAAQYAVKNCKTQEEFALAGEICGLLSAAYAVQLKNINDSLMPKALSLQAIAHTMANEAQRAYVCYKQVSCTENNKVATFENHLRQIIADAQKALAEIAGNSKTNTTQPGENPDDFEMVN